MAYSIYIKYMIHVWIFSTDSAILRNWNTVKNYSYACRQQKGNKNKILICMSSRRKQEQQVWNMPTGSRRETRKTDQTKEGSRRETGRNSFDYDGSRREIRPNNFSCYGRRKETRKTLFSYGSSRGKQEQKW